MRDMTRRNGRRRWSTRAAAIGIPLALSAGAPAVGTLPTPVAPTAEASAQDNRERVTRWWRFSICRKQCPGYGWCCYERPEF